MRRIKGWELFNNTLLKESVLKASSDFLNIIFNISLKNNKIAKILLNIINRDVKTDINLLDIGDRNDEITFVSDSKVSILYGLLRNIKIGRAVRKILTLNDYEISDKEVLEFVNLYKMEYDSTKKKSNIFEIVEGEELRKWYLEENYVPGGGQLNNSCMRYKASQKYFDIYCENPDVCKLIILKDDKNRLLGRALIWKLLEPVGDSDWLLDRIYTRYDYESDKFHDFFQNWSNSYDYPYYGGELKNVKVQLDKWDFEMYPYMDTFKLLEYKSGILKTYLDFRSSEELLELEDTKGGFTKIN